MKLYSLLNSLLCRIEDTLTDSPSADELASSLYVSSVHLQRLFKASFGNTIAGYIRSRKLTESINDLFSTDMPVIDIGAKYGFDHTQSYIRAFKREFSITPGELRKSGQIVKVTPPIHLFSHNDFSDGLLFGPEIVFVPEFFCVGLTCTIPIGAPAEDVANVAKDFWFNSKNAIQNIKQPETYIGLTVIPSHNAEFSLYTPSVCVTDIETVPQGFEGNAITSGLYAKFHYVAEHHYLDINADVAADMYDKIWAFIDDENSHYGILRKKPFFERIPVYEFTGDDYDGSYCCMEWFAPVYDKMAT